MKNGWEVNEGRRVLLQLGWLRSRKYEWRIIVGNLKTSSTLALLFQLCLLLFQLREELHLLFITLVRGHGVDILPQLLPLSRLPLLGLPPSPREFI